MSRRQSTNSALLTPPSPSTNPIEEFASAASASAAGGGGGGVSPIGQQQHQPSSPSGILSMPSCRPVMGCYTVVS